MALPLRMLNQSMPQYLSSYMSNPYFCLSEGLFCSRNEKDFVKMRFDWGIINNGKRFFKS